MSFFQNVKNKLGIGGVHVSLQVPGQVAKGSGVVEGKIILTTKSEQEIVSYKVKMIEEYTTGRGDEKKTKTFELGLISSPVNMVIKPGETKEFPFSLPFSLLKSDNDQLKEKGGVLGALGKMGSFASNEKSEYFVDADVDVKSAALDPSDKKEIRLM
jgi:sporulation-control protein spo0M